MRRFLRDNGLSVTLFALFLISLVGRSSRAGRQTPRNSACMICPRSASSHT